MCIYIYIYIHTHSGVLARWWDGRGSKFFNPQSAEYGVFFCWDYDADRFKPTSCAACRRLLSLTS